MSGPRPSHQRVAEPEALCNLRPTTSDPAARHLLPQQSPCLPHAGGLTIQSASLLCARRAESPHSHSPFNSQGSAKAKGG